MVMDVLKKIMVVKNRFSLAVVFILFLCCEAFGAPSFTASLDRNTISLGESANLSLTFTEASQGAPTLPAIPNLRIGYIGQSSRVNIVNGSASSTLTHKFQVTPTAVGDFVIPAVRINVGGTVLTSQPLTLKVVQRSSAETGPQLGILRLKLPKTAVYVGEPFVASLELCLHRSVVEMSNPNITPLQADGFTVGKFTQLETVRTVIGNETYTVYPLQIPMTAIKPGMQKIGEAQCAITVYFEAQNFFRRTPGRNLNFVSEPQTLQVLPLPTSGQPATFSGAIGNFSMTFSAAPTNIAVGDPITMKITISGRGALDLLSLPQQTEWREFKTYPATSKVESNDSLGLQGAKTFEQVVVPENSAVKELPSYSFSFFDPEQKTYRTLTHPAIPLTVRPTAAMPQPTVFSNDAQAKSEEPSSEIVHIKPRTGTLATSSVPLVQQPWFWMLQGMPPLVWIASIIARKRRENFRNNPRLRREREVSKIVSHGLKELSQHASAKESDQFFATVFRLLQEQIGERLDLPASAITESVIDERLRPKGASAATLELIHELFQACNQARYASQRTSQELASYIPKVETAIEELRKLK